MRIHKERGTPCRCVAAALLILVATPAAFAQTVTTIYSFQGSPNDGQQPGGVVAGPGGVLYGFAGGGASNNGMVFSLTPPSASGGAWSETVLYNFKGEPGDGSGPISLATGTDSHGRFVLYGLTGGGGTQKGGTAFMMKPPASAGASWNEAVIYDFPKLAGYAHPFPLLLNGGLAVGAEADGRPVLYGTTFEGGSGTCRLPSMGCGTVYSVTPPAKSGERWTETTLYSFNGDGVDGFFPGAGVVIGVGPDGRLTLFGTTGAGGVGGGGTVFALSAPEAAGGAWTETILTSFRWSGPSFAFTPKAAVTIGRGTNGYPLLYGTAEQGGNYFCPNIVVFGCGAVFALAPPASAGGAWTRGELYDFQTCCGDAYGPTTALVVASGANGQPVLYGTTYQGGSSNVGAVYSVVPPASGSGAWTETVLHSFTGVPPDGALTGGMVMGSGGILYGVTAEGGTPNNFGTVFSLQP